LDINEEEIYTEKIKNLKDDPKTIVLERKE